MSRLAKAVSPESLESFCIAAMTKAGLSVSSAKITAKVLVDTDRWGVHTHGSKQLRGLLKNYRDGLMDIAARPELLSEGPGWAVYDGCRSMPPVSSVVAMAKAIEKARNVGIACATIKNSGHYGAAGYYANMAAECDMVGISMTNVDPGVAVPGSRVPVMGTNPIAYAVPAGAEHTIMLDIATSIVAASKIFAAQDLGKSIPEGWIIDKDGLPTSDSAGYPEVGALMPMAGHKGYGIALLVELLTGVLAGGAFGNAVTSWVMHLDEPVNQSHNFIAINVGCWMPIEKFKRRVDELIGQIRSVPRAKGVDRIYLPGEMEWEYYDRVVREGVMHLPADVIDRLSGLAADYDMDISTIYA